MPRARYTAEGGTYRIDGQSFEPGDEHEVSREVAEHLADVDDFEVIVEKGDAAPREEDGPPDEDGEDFLVNGWLENDYQDRADAVLEGGLDDYLDEIEDAETSETVIEAVQERRDELEG